MISALVDTIIPSYAKTFQNFRLISIHIQATPVIQHTTEP